MATVTRDSIGKLHDKITVKLSKEDYLPSFEKSLKQFAKTANVPGFRKGMVPAGMVKKMYGPSIFNDEVIRSAGQKLDEYLREQQVAIFAQPMILPNENPLHLDMNAPADVDFSFEIGLKPDFEITPLKEKATLPHYTVAVSDKMVEDEVERIVRRFGKVENPETITSTENILYATYEVVDAEGNVTGEPIQETVLVEKLPAKLQEMVMSKNAGDSFVFRPADVCTEEELAAFLKDPLKMGEEAAQQEFKLTITKVGVLVPRELDIVLFAEVFPNDDITTEEAFKARIKEELSKEYARVASDRLNNEIFELLVHQTPIELPVPFLKRWMRNSSEKPKTEAEVEAEFSSFEHQLRWTLISDKLIIDNNINVSMEEITENVKSRVLGYFGMTEEDEAPWLDSYMQKVMKDEKTVNETYRQMLFERLFKFLQTQFNLEEKEVSEEEFFKLPDAHAAHHHHH